MKLLFDCHSFDAGPQGTTTFLAGLLNALPEAANERGHVLSMACAAEQDANILRYIKSPYSYAKIAHGFIRRNAVDLPQLTGALRPNAIVSQYVRPFRSATHTVSVIHDVLFLDNPELFGWRYRNLRRLLFGWSARHSDVVITVSAYSRARIAHYFGLAPDRIDVLPNALDVVAPLPDIDEVGRPSDAPLRLLYVSRFETRKRQHWCLAAAYALAAQGRAVELTLVGHAEGHYADTVRAAIAAGGLSGAQIVIRSDVSATELDALYCETDLFLFPSQCEGFGIPVIEAAAYGIPCVVMANTAIVELQGCYAGIGVVHDDKDAFVHAVLDATATLTVFRREALDIAPRTRAAYRWPDVARAFVAILERRGILA